MKRIVLFAVIAVVALVTFSNEAWARGGGHIGYSGHHDSTHGMRLEMTWWSLPVAVGIGVVVALIAFKVVRHSIVDPFFTATALGAIVLFAPLFVALGIAIVSETTADHLFLIFLRYASIMVAGVILGALLGSLSRPKPTEFAPPK